MAKFLKSVVKILSLPETTEFLKRKRNNWKHSLDSGPYNMIGKKNGCGMKSVKKVQVGKDQEKAQSEKDSHSKNRGGKKPNLV